MTLLECACNKDGSIDSTCDITSGHCSCIDNVGGDKCDTCHNGWYDFPSCQGELYHKISCKLILLYFLNYRQNVVVTLLVPQKLVVLMMVDIVHAILDIQELNVMSVLMDGICIMGNVMVSFHYSIYVR